MIPARASGAGHPAKWWRPLEDGRVLCQLCPRHCRPNPGRRGYCLIRRNEAGQLVTDGWNAGIGFVPDPIEKKPLFHVHPGSRVLSFGTAGCNLGCLHCQNWSMSQTREALAAMQPTTAAGIVSMAQAQGCQGLAFTYNEPVIFGEFVLACSRAAREAGLISVVVSNGYVEPAVATEIFSHIDAANIDLKAFSEEGYRRITRGRLAPVLESLRHLRRLGRTWLELTTLLIPGLNDGESELRELCRWVAGELGTHTPLHFTAYHPAHRLRVAATPAATLYRAQEIAQGQGLRFVYLGNLPLDSGQDTHCPQCRAAVVERRGFTVLRTRLKRGVCAACGSAVPGVWLDRMSTQSSQPVGTA